MIARAASGPGAQETHEHNLFHARAPRGVHHTLRALAVDAGIRLHANFAIYSRTVNDGIAAGKRGGELGFVIRARRMKRGVPQFANGFVTAIRPASNNRSEERRVGKECRSRWS